MKGIECLAAAGWGQGGIAIAVVSPRFVRTGLEDRLAHPVHTIVSPIMENVLVTSPAAVPVVPFPLVVPNEVAARALPHFAVVEGLEGAGNATVVVIASRAAVSVDVVKEDRFHLHQLFF